MSCYCIDTNDDEQLDADKEGQDAPDAKTARKWPTREPEYDGR